MNTINLAKTLAALKKLKEPVLGHSISYVQIG